MTERERLIASAILSELANTPSGYLQPETALRASLRLSVCPEPSAAEVDSALRRLEADAAIHCEPSALKGKRWSITSIGRALLAD